MKLQKTNDRENFKHIIFKGVLTDSKQQQMKSVVSEMIS